MLKARYNFLAFLQAFIGLTNLILNLIYFGVSDQANGYLLSNSILASYFLLLMMICEQFQYEYKKIICESKKESRIFFSNYVTMGAVVGVILYVTTLFFGSRLVEIMMPGLNEASKDILVSYLNILNIVIILYIPYQICILKLVSENKLTLSYLITMLPSVFQLFGILSHIYFHSDMLLIIKMILYGYIFAFSISILLSKYSFNDFDRNYLKPVINSIVDSMKIKGIHNIHNYLTILFMNNFISSYSTDRVSIFLYLKKISETAMQITYGPTHKLAINIFSEALQKNKIIKIILWRKKLDFILPILILIITILMVVLVFITSNYVEVVKEYKIFIIINLTLLMIQTILQTLELPSAIINLWYKDFSVFLRANILYIITLYTLTSLLEFEVNIYALSLSMVLSQIINLIIIRKNSNKYLLKNG